ncbi:MAG: DUF4350 domain-containing protein [Sedimentisphaerales bacterium]|nr:DUF4350 domain-containing protein [Sedimentisphaerales bacterium]
MVSIRNALKFFLLFSLLVIACEQPIDEREGFSPGKKKKINQRPMILFDAFKEQTWSIKDTGFTGYSSLNLFLKDLGYRTAENHKPYNEVLTNLGAETLFVIGVAMEARFNEDEIVHILDFLGRGGKVLIIAEHHNQYGSSDFLRPIANAGGWEINNDCITDDKDALPKNNGWIKTVLPSKKEGPVFLCAASLTAIWDEGREVLLTSLNGGHIVAGLGSYKKGRIATLTDSEFLWNANPEYKWEGLHLLAFSDPKTGAFVKDLIFKIHPLKDRQKLNDFSFPSTQRSSKRVFVYGNGGDFHDYSKFFTALADVGISVFKYQEGITPADGVIVISPLKRIPKQVIDNLSKSQKVIIFGDMYSSVKSYADSWESFFKPFKIYPIPYPVNALAEKYGVRFLPYYGVNLKDNEHGNILYIPVFFQKKRLYLHGACAVGLLTGDKNEEICFENSKDTFACGAGFGLNHPLKSRHQNDLKNPVFLVATDSVLAIGDSDIIINAFLLETERTGILDEIVKFLKS